MISIFDFIIQRIIHYNDLTNLKNTKNFEFRKQLKTFAKKYAYVDNVKNN